MQFSAPLHDTIHHFLLDLKVVFQKRYYCTMIRQNDFQATALWEGLRLYTSDSPRYKVLVRGALICAACDIPAARKLCGFKGHNGNRVCVWGGGGVQSVSNCLLGQ